MPTQNPINPEQVALWYVLGGCIFDPFRAEIYTQHSEAELNYILS